MEQIAEDAVVLLQDADLHGRKYAIGAALAAVALRQPGRVDLHLGRGRHAQISGRELGDDHEKRPPAPPRQALTP